MSDFLLSAQDVTVEFPLADGNRFRAVDGVSLDIKPGETLGVVGESGCGKSTLARAILRLGPMTAGEVTFQGRSLAGLSPREMRPIRRDLQVVFQDPLASLNPRRTAGQLIAEPIQALMPELSSRDRDARVREVMERVGLSRRQVNGYPYEFSGGQCQRIGIARALAVSPKLIVCDEPVSALDVSIQAQIVNLLMELQREESLALMFIAHDLSVVRHISHRVMVMNRGQVVESGLRDDIYESPQQDYTRRLLAAVPVADPAVQRKRLHAVQMPVMETPALAE